MLFLVVSVFKLTNSFHIVHVDFRLDFFLFHKLLFDQCGSLDWCDWLERSSDFRCEEITRFLLSDQN